APRASVKTYNQDGYMSMREQTGHVNYQPSTNVPEVVDNPKFKYSKSTFAVGTTTAQATIDKENNFQQAGDLYESFSKKDKDNLIKNLSCALNAVKNKVIVHKMIAHFYQANEEYGTRLMKATNTSFEDVKKYINK